MSIDTIVSKVSDDPGSCEYWSKVPEPREDLEVQEPFDTFETLVRKDADVAEEYIEQEEGLIFADFNLDTRSGESRKDDDDESSVMLSISKMEFIGGDFVYCVNERVCAFLKSSLALIEAWAFKLG